ncbi:unnamed protein product [Onchocerca flexuosa]|uniref:WH1 domain-containing protein n=1 Tax=Onchocerca flexuosa TaxID=387005 RepID=A0A183HMM5_9BILA|nr:unnamed protein product [Onchocerca flexuosa]
MSIKDDEQPLLYDRVISTKFLPATDIPNTARVRLVLYNISQRPITYECIKRYSDTAESGASGTIPAQGIAYCLLIWRRAPEVNSWKNMKSASLIMITEFEDSSDPTINEHTIIKIKCMTMFYSVDPIISFDHLNHQKNIQRFYHIINQHITYD